MTPGERYASDLEREGFRRDPAQAEAVALFDDLHGRLLASPEEPGLGARLRGLLGRPARRDPVRGLYLWGGVGRGKTYLMDLFFDCLPFEQKLRMHFHRFMRRTHEELGRLAGTSDPLVAAAERLASEARVICFDEFFVSDITDAMILAELFDALFARGVTLVATSNVEPGNLYRDGLQRRRFLPAIDLIERHCRVLHMDGGTDHRLRTLEQAELYHWPLDAGAETSLAASFAALAPETGRRDVVIEIEGRPIPARAECDDVAWFDFAALCDGPRSQNDYIELAREYHAVLVSGVPRFDTRREDQARRFIALVDEFYDRGVKLILSAEVPIPELYGGERLLFEFERTASRLLEMQSHAYLARVHRA
ncbi:MAG: cell division protein ZapE [Pseudomonadales bacterium]|jgi:cell division protein ZapE|nr:cell division protein ZapE [Pseudomonadales bacterium]